MIRLKEFFSFYINSSIHVSISVCCLQAIMMIKYSSIINYDILCFTFFSTLFAYNFIKYFEYIYENYSSISIKLKLIICTSIFSLFFSLFFLFKLALNEILLIALISIITLLYAVPFFLFSDTNLRSVRGLKIYVVALVWTMTVVLLPFEFYMELGLLFLIINFIQIFIYVLIAIVPFEIRDINIDNRRLSTIPQKIGIKNTKILGVILCLPFVLIELLKQKYFSWYYLGFDFIIIALLMVFLIISSKNPQSKFYSSFWVEGVPILWIVILLI
jgi:hypothetical protein